LNRTLDNVKTIMRRSAAERVRVEQLRLAELKRLEQAAAPILTAYSDLKDQYLRVSVLKQLWPDDFGSRGDRVSALLLGFVAERGMNYGLAIRVPAGQMRFFVQQQKNDELIYIATRDIGDAPPAIREFINRDDWVGYFLRTLANMIDLLE
jgi:hypothetical protein